MTPKSHQTSGGCMLHDHARSFNCSGVAAIARSIYLMTSNLGRKGGAWPHPKQHHSVPQRPRFSSIDWLLEVNQQSLLNHTASSWPKHTTATRPCCHTACPHKSSPHFVWGGAIPPHCNHIHTHPALQYRCILPH
jgi:hypothetical protein